MTAPPCVITELEQAIARASDDRKAEMLMHVTDLFVLQSDHCSDAEIALFDDIIVRLASQIETEARARLSERLARIEKAPKQILRVLADDDEIDVAGPVLRHSLVLDEPTLVVTARTKSQHHLMAISKRETLSKAVTDVLVERGERQVVLSVLENRGAAFSERGFTILVRRSEGDDALAISVGGRAEIPEHLFLKLLSNASDRVRRKLEAENPRARREVSEVVAEVTDRIRTQIRNSPADFETARALVHSIHITGQLDQAKLAAFAKAGKREESIVALALLCDLPESMIERAMDSERAELLMIYGRANGMTWNTMKALLRVRAGTSGLSARDIEHALANYERLKPATAQQLVRFHVMGQDQKRKPS